MPKILITGANGFVGKHLINELLGNSYDVIAIGGSQVAALDEIGGVEYMTLDLSNAEEAQKIDFKDVSGVIHLAGLAAVGPSFDKPITPTGLSLVSSMSQCSFIMDCIASSLNPPIFWPSAETTS
jgi:dihydroflavonol-4-reductase